MSSFTKNAENKQHRIFTIFGYIMICVKKLIFIYCNLFLIKFSIIQNKLEL